jgi:hypothetical protein
MLCAKPLALATWATSDRSVHKTLCRKRCCQTRLSNRQFLLSKNNTCVRRLHCKAMKQYRKVAGQGTLQMPTHDDITCCPSAQLQETHIQTGNSKLVSALSLIHKLHPFIAQHDLGHMCLSLYFKVQHAPTSHAPVSHSQSITCCLRSRRASHMCTSASGHKTFMQGCAALHLLLMVEVLCSAASLAPLAPQTQLYIATY